MIEIRKYLHKFPEVSGKEKETSAFIKEKLREIGVEKIHDNFSEYSLIAEIDSGEKGKTIAFRCELDALPINETGDFEHRSTQKGVSHKCGHDGHMVMMLGLAEKLLNAKLPGKFLLIFQSAEENGNGAKSIMESGKLKEFNIDFIFSLHNIPGAPTGKIICKPGIFTPNVESLDIKLKGKTSHAGMPEKGINPAQILPEIINYFKSIHFPHPQKKEYFLATPIQIKLGKPAYGISAGEALVSYTFRSWKKDYFEQKKKEIIDALKEIFEKQPELETSLKWKLAFNANVNDQKAYETIKKAAQEKDYDFEEKKEPFSFGEDFGGFTQELRGAMFGLGAGENTPELHHPDYDFPDEIHEVGVEMFFRIAKIASES